MWQGLPPRRLEAVRRLFTENNDEAFLVRPRGKEKDMVLLFLLTLAFVVLAGAAYWWEVNSSDWVNSSEWERRQRWFGFL
jgi:hypothetical protein